MLEYLTSTLCHLTVCSQGLLATYLVLVQTGAVEAAAMMAVIVMPLEGLVGVLYWTIVLYDPWWLFPRDEFPKDQQKADRIIRQVVFGPTNFKHPELIVFWLFMHLQHTVAPLHLFVEAAYGVVPGKPYSITTECGAAVAAGLVYLIWNLFTWHARGIAPYPIQHKVATSWSSKLLFYGGCAIVVVMLSAMSVIVRSTDPIALIQQAYGKSTIGA